MSTHLCDQERLSNNEDSIQGLQAKILEAVHDMKEFLLMGTLLRTGKGSVPEKLRIEASSLQSAVSEILNDLK